MDVTNKEFEQLVGHCNAAMTGLLANPEFMNQMLKRHPDNKERSATIAKHALLYGGQMMSVVAQAVLHAAKDSE